MIQIVPSLSFSEALNASTSKILQFHGRSRRSEFWWTQLLIYIISLLLTPFVGCLLSLLTIPLTFRRLHDTGRSGWWWGCGALLKLAFAVFLGYDIVIAIANADNLIGHEYGLLIRFFLKYGIFSLVIAVYQIVLLVFYCLDSDPYENRYGDSPKYDDGGIL